jgi:hypothetical protein
LGIFLSSNDKVWYHIESETGFRLSERDFHLQIHENAEKILLKAHVSYRERIIYKNSKLIEEEKELRFFRKLFQLYLIYLQQSGEKGILKQMIGYIKFLRFRTHYENPLKVLYYHIFVKRKQENKY